jgi:hypothetical protein
MIALRRDDFFRRAHRSIRRAIPRPWFNRMRPPFIGCVQKGGLRMRWIFLLAGMASVAALYGVGPPFALPMAFAALCANFTTFCLQYDDPANRARRRVATQLARLSPSGLYAEEYQRLQSATLRITDEDRATRYGLMTIINLASGIVALGLVAWGLSLRFT